MAILGDFGEFEVPVPEPPFSYHQTRPQVLTEFQDMQGKITEIHGHKSTPGEKA